MLMPEYFEGKTDIVEQYYRRYEDYLLNKIAETLLKAGELGGNSDRYLFILKQLELGNNEIIEKLAKLTRQSQSAVRKVLQGSVMTSFSNDKEVLERYFEGEFGPLDNPVITEVMNAEWIKTCGELENLANTTMNQYHMDVVNLLDQAELRVASGAQSYSSAACEVLDNYAKSGMTINYPTGARRSLEAAIRCAIVTSMNQTAAQVTNKYIAEGGIEYVLVSAHLGARHSDKGGLYSHDEWQGKAYKIRGSEEGYPNLLDSTGYDINPDTGEGLVVNPHGLHGYNCRHSHQPWARDLRNPWINDDGTPKVSTSESQQVYENQQRQRGMERSIRQTKRQLNMKQFELELLPEGSAEHEKAQVEYDRLAYKLRLKNMKYGEFCANHNLSRQMDRVKTAGWTKADSQKANGRAAMVANDKKVEAIAKANGDDIIKIKGRSVNKREFMELDFSEMSKYIEAVPNEIVREWYIKKDKNIINLIDRSQSLEEQARQAFELRNTYRTQARDLMSDQKTRAYLDENEPNSTFDELVRHKIEDKGLTGDKIYMDILRSAGITNQTVNSILGVEG